jgi:hypothetical protein
MIRYWLFGALLGAATVLFAQIAVPPTTKTLTITGMCEGTTWKAYRTKTDDLWVGCGAAVPPAKAVELREYYVVPSGGPRK